LYLCCIAQGNQGKQGSISSTCLCSAFLKLFCAQLIATCKWQPAQVTVTCKLHIKHIFGMKKHGEICFQTQAGFFVFCIKKLRVNMLMKMMPGWHNHAAKSHAFSPKKLCKCKCAIICSLKLCQTLLRGVTQF
jgi:hypothetical protein